MKVKELIRELESCDENDEVFFDDNVWMLPITSIEKLTNGNLSTEILLKTNKE